MEKRVPLNESVQEVGWLLTLRTITAAKTLESSSNYFSTTRSKSVDVSGLELLFLRETGDVFRRNVFYAPYLYLSVSRPDALQPIVVYCQRQFQQYLQTVEIVRKVDLSERNHLARGKSKTPFIKLSFFNSNHMTTVRRELQEEMNKRKQEESGKGGASSGSPAGVSLEVELEMMNAELELQSDDALLWVSELREYDVPYHVRSAIDLDLRVGAWYTIESPAPFPGEYEIPGEYDVHLETPDPSISISVTRMPEKVDQAHPKILAFDIECTKAPLKFPDAAHDQIYMISYMVNGDGYLIVNREHVSEDIDSFEYTPKPEYHGPFDTFNESNEYALLTRFISHVSEVSPHIYVTYNGDSFDWPFLEARIKFYGLNFESLNISRDNTGAYLGDRCIHMDAFYWVKRDSYLPQGSQGLKAVTKNKLGYDPVEVDPEEMLPLARDEPYEMATYSVSDAVATFYLYKKYVHLFIFSLCTVIPMKPEEVLRKGSGTLCETLLMVEAFKCDIICPNKQVPSTEFFFHHGHPVENETYVGGHVECIESGVFRSDLNYTFQIHADTVEDLIRNIDRDLRFAIETEQQVKKGDVMNYTVVKNTIVAQLRALQEMRTLKATPLIYHLDVGAMYPNIILTNRLQPTAIVDEKTCANCLYNTICGDIAVQENKKKRSENDSKNKNIVSCQRQLEWIWRGDYYPLTQTEYGHVKGQLLHENVKAENEEERQAQIKARLKSYCSRVYKKIRVTDQQKRQATVCMREHPFYVDTVRAFRDRRYEYKVLTKKWAKKANDPLENTEKAKERALVYDSLQLAHKCILNSFYGYVMRKGARWHSMEMAGIVTNTGANIINRAKNLIERIGRPLELDTDGIWCILPSGFPETFTLQLREGGTRNISYPCVMLNADLHEKFSNHQYHEKGMDEKYQMRSECSIFFEVDGPYRCMVLPASKEEGKTLKKRYAVFNMDNSLAELKGFEIKRRGELQIVKSFQAEVFKTFLDGNTLEECYASVAECANRCLDIIDSQGEYIENDELLELLSEKKNMSGKLEDYGNQKSLSITTATRLSEFLGSQMVADKGLACQMIIANRPAGLQVTDRAIPTAIFATEEDVKQYYLRRWLGDSSITDYDIRSIIDWDYYRQRLGSTIIKIISLPAVLQGLKNPVSRICLPDWVKRKHQNQKSGIQQTIQWKKLENRTFPVQDIEEIGKSQGCKEVSKAMSNLNVKSKARTEEAETKEPETEESETEQGETEEAEKKKKKKSTEKTIKTFDSWLEERKTAWKGQRVKKKRDASRSLLRSVQTDTARRGHSNEVENLNTFFQSSLTSGSGYWQILECMSMDVAGVYQLWVITNDGLMHPIQMEIPKVFYLKCESEEGINIGRVVHRFLPHSLPSHDIYEVQMKEAAYVEKEKEFNLLFCDPKVFGVYERRLKGIFRGILAMGCVADVDMTHKENNAKGKTKYELQDMTFKSVDQCPYLSENVPIQRMVFYHSVHKSGVGVVGLFLVEKAKEEQKKQGEEGGQEEQEEQDKQQEEKITINSYVWLIDNGAGNQVHLSNIFRQVNSSKNTTANFDLQIVKEEKEAFLAITRVLNEHNRLYGSRPAIVQSVSSYRRSQQLRQLIPGLNNYPICVLPFTKEDELVLGVQWRDQSCTHMLNKVLEVTTSWDEILSFSRYAHIPLGNLSGDYAVATLDVLFSRVLQKNRHILWGSPSNTPDLGQSEDLSAHSMDTEVNETVSIHGAYPQICAVIQIDGLAIATIFVANQISSMEEMIAASEITSSSKQTQERTLDDGYNGCERAFKMLRTLVVTLLKDFTQNPQAEYLLQHLFRWISSPTSLSYDPALHMMLLTLMRKLFMLLLNEFKKLGTQIVYADFQKIIICTKKETLQDAEMHCKYILKNILSNDLFNLLNFTPLHYYSHLLFMDIENHGGIQVKICERDMEIDDKTAQMEAEEKEEETPSQLISHWNIVQHLPSGVSDYFLLLIGQYITRLSVYSSKNVCDAEEGTEMDQEKYNDYSRSLVTSRIAPKLADIVSNIQTRQWTAADFPVHSGSHLDMKDPALELVKFVCHVLSMDINVKEVVETMKRSMVKALRYSEFDTATSFIDPSLTFPLNNMICTECGYCQHLDLCRNEEYLSYDEEDEENEKKGDPKERVWCCPSCTSPYDKENIEWHLMELFKYRVREYETQDYYCRSCKLPTEYLLQPTCVFCTRPLEYGSKEIQPMIRILHKIARNHKMENLEEMLDEFL